MQSFGDDQDVVGYNDGSSDEEQDDEGQMEDQDEGDQDAEDDEPDGEGLGEENDDERIEDNEEDEEDQSQDASPIRRQDRPSLNTQTSLSSNRSFDQGIASFSAATQPAPTSHPRPTVLPTTPSPRQTTFPSSTGIISLPLVRQEALTAPVYDIVPTIAAPHSTSINAITATPDLRWVFSGGADGYIRKFNWVETANGKVMLTVAQRHPFVDSVTKAGVLTSYWENEEPQAKAGEDGQSLSSVYSLAVHNQGLWLLSGLESGGINLQSVRHEEGKRITCLKKHTSAVSVLNLAHDERSVLSGSWDKSILDWDLNTGQVKRSFEGSGGQISAIEMRPISSLPIPETAGETASSNGTLSGNNTNKPRLNGILANGIPPDTQADPIIHETVMADGTASPTDSLFGGNDGDSLFGDNDDDTVRAPSGGNFGDDDDDEFSRAIANGIQQQENEDAEGDVSMVDTNGVQSPPQTNGNLDTLDIVQSSSILDFQPLPAPEESVAPLTNGSANAEYLELPDAAPEITAFTSDATQTADSTFLAASFDGTVRVWDKRKATPAAKIIPRNVPPWCMNACWSPDGNFIYAGRRNGTVEEFSLHKGLGGVERTFKFPNGSGAVSAVRAMPNGRHLICASYDILRLYDLQQQQTFKHLTVPFLIVPGHRTGVVSQLYIDPTCRYMISTAGNRGWDGNSTEVLLGYEIGIGG